MSDVHRDHSISVGFLIIVDTVVAGTVPET